MATVLVTAAAQEQFRQLPRVIQVRMERVFSRLERWPAVSGVKALTGKLSGRYRMRTGDYRIEFRVASASAALEPQSKLIYIEKVGHRDGFYER